MRINKPMDFLPPASAVRSADRLTDRNTDENTDLSTDMNTRANSDLPGLRCPLETLRPALLVLGIAVVSSGAAFATPSIALVKDINPGPAASNPSILTKSNSVLYFTADDGANGRELWKTDGTSAGTAMVMDIYPGATASDPLELFDFNGKLYFSAIESNRGRELWVHDPATTVTTPTHRVKDIFPGSIGSFPDTFTNLAGKLLFRADDDDHGKELYITDGTAANTALVKDIRPGSGGSYPKYLTVVGSYVYFQVDDGLEIYGNELWRTDGNADGTILVSDINPGNGDCYPKFFAVLDGDLYFRGFDGNAAQKGYELWTADGSTTFTARVKDIWPGRTSSDPEDLTTIGSSILFSANDGTHGRELWATDGTEDGTAILADIAEGPDSSSPTHFFDAGGTLVFRANETDTTYELWISDGTEAGTARLRTFARGPTPPDTFIERSVYANGFLYFPAYDEAHGAEIWVSDLTPEGTVLLGDIAPGTASSFAFPVHATDAGVLCSADVAATGRELYTVTPRQQIDVTPTNLDFGIVTSGTLVNRTVTVSNVGRNYNLSFTGNKVVFAGPDAAEFSYAPLNPPSIPPGEKIDLTVTLNPVNEEPKSATMVILTDDPDDQAFTVNLVGTPLETNIEVSPASTVEFSFFTSATLETRFVRIRNTAPLKPLEFTGDKIKIIGLDYANFSLSPAIPDSIAPGAEFVLSVTLIPYTFTDKYAGLVITTNDPDQPTITLSLVARWVNARALFLW